MGIKFELIQKVINDTDTKIICIDITNQYLKEIVSYIDKSLGTNTYSIETKYYVIANKESTVNNIKELKESDTIEYYKYSRSIEKALKKLGNYNYVSSDAASKSMENVTNNNSYFLIASVNYDYLMESTNLYSRDNYKIIGEFNVKEEIKKNNTIKNVYNIYINGLDFTGIMRDYNLIATVNLNTQKIYLEIPFSYDEKIDKIESILSDVLVEIKKELGISVGRVCRGERKKCGGYIWVYKEKYTPQN